MDKPKLKLAVYWGAACGGCCVSVLDVHEKLFDIVAAADLVFWPIAMDIKYKDVEAFPDGYIDVTLFNGAVRNSENEHMAKLLRKRPKCLLLMAHAPIWVVFPDWLILLIRKTCSEEFMRKPNLQLTLIK